MFIGGNNREWEKKGDVKIQQPRDTFSDAHSFASQPLSQWKYLEYGKAPFTNGNARRNGEHFATEPSYRFSADIKLEELQKKVRRKMGWLRRKIDELGWEKVDTRLFQPDQLLQAVLSDWGIPEDFGLAHDRFYIHDRLKQLIEAERTAILTQVNARYRFDFAEEPQSETPHKPTLRAAITKESHNRRFDPKNPQHLTELRERMIEAVKVFKCLTWERGTYSEKVLENELSRPHAVKRSQLFSRRDLIAMLCLCGLIESVPNNKKGGTKSSQVFRITEKAKAPNVVEVAGRARDYFAHG